MKMHPLVLKIYEYNVERQPCFFSKWPLISRLPWINHLKNYFIGILDPQNLYFGTRITTIGLIVSKIHSIAISHGGHFEKWPPRPPQAESEWLPYQK